MSWNLSKTYCRKCGKTADDAILDALAVLCGARVSPDPTFCPDGEEHDFTMDEPKPSSGTNTPTNHKDKWPWKH